MDEASRLILELQVKLQELDHKILLYRHEMTSEFTKYSNHLLHDTPDDVSATVKKALAESLKSFPQLVTDRGEVDILTTTDTKDPGRIAGSIPMETQPASGALHYAPEAQVDGPRSPHEREREFRGIFTPPFLPLLDSTDRNERRRSSESVPPLSTVDRAPSSIPVDTGFAQIDTSTASSSSFDPYSLPRPKPPTPKRRNTDDASIHSNRSDSSTKPRSALRRSSSSAKLQSPRRVRFEFEGEEFPTTSSPMTAPSVLTVIEPHPISTILDDDSEDEAGSQQVEDIEDSHLPKKISSSQALKLLSRKPLEDDGTEWVTQVNGDSSDEEDLLTMSKAKRSTKPVNTNGVKNMPDTPENSGSKAGADDADVEGNNVDTGVNTSEEDDILVEMTSPRPMRSQRMLEASGPLPTGSGSLEGSTKTVLTRITRKPWFDLEDGTPGDYNPIRGQEELPFEFEDSIGPSHLTPDPVEPENAGELDEEEDSDTTSPEPTLSGFATSLPRPVNHRRSVEPPIPILEASFPMSMNPTGSYQSGSLRSTPQPYDTPIVSEAMQAKVASLGLVSAFVGSLNGASGIDESDIRAYRASGGFVGSFRDGFEKGVEPKSLSERMMFEEWMEESARMLGPSKEELGKDKGKGKAREDVMIFREEGSKLDKEEKARTST